MTFHAFTHVEDPLLLDLVMIYLDFCFSSSAFSLALCSLIVTGFAIAGSVAERSVVAESQK